MTWSASEVPVSGAEVAAVGPRLPELRVWGDGASRTLKPAPSVNSGFSEGQEAVFLIDADPQARLFVDDVPLTMTMVDGRAGWRWQPGFYAGEVKAELIDRYGSTTATWRLDVSPAAHKLGSELFTEILDDLRQFDPSFLIGQESAQHNLGALGATEDPFVALARLRQYDRELVRSLRALIQQPRHALRARRDLVRPQSMRRADRQTLRSAIQRPATLATLIQRELTSAHGIASTIVVDVPSVERHLDSPANRCALAMIQALVRRYADVHDRLAIQVEREVPAETSTALRDRWPRWKSFLEERRQAFQEVTSRHPFNRVRRAEVTAAGLNAIAADPVYARFHRLVTESLRSGVEGNDESGLIPISPTWEIYERWCFVEIGRRLRAKFPDWHWARTDLTTLVGQSPGAALIHLHLQPSFTSTNGKPRSGFWSISRQRYPDIVLTFEHGDLRSFVVFDAKYRVSRVAVLDAMSSAHIYQDSLRMGRQRPLWSVLLVPREGGASWLESRDSIVKNKVGVLPLWPAMETSELEWLVSNAIEFMSADQEW
jgi:hypothetical protein